MAAFVDQYIQPEGYLAIHVVTKIVGLLLKLAVKGGGAMLKMTSHCIGTLANTARDTIVPSRVNLLTSPCDPGETGQSVAMAPRLGDGV